MKTVFTLFVIITSPLLLFAQQKWVAFKIDNRVSIEFPFPPAKVDSSIFMCINSDSANVHAVYTLDLIKMGADSAMIEKVKNQPDFASGLGQAAIKSFKGLKMADIKIGSRQGFTSYTTSGTDGQGKIYQLLMLIVGSKFYSFLECHVPQLKDEKSSYFFSSTIIK